MGTKNIRVTPVKMTLGDSEYELHYTMASFAYLSEKYGDIGKVFSIVSKANDKNMADFLSMDFLRAIADFIYAGVMRPDVDKIEEGKNFVESDVSGFSYKGILKETLGLGLNDIKTLSDSISIAISGALPDADPTKAEKSAKK